MRAIIIIIAAILLTTATASNSTPDTSQDSDKDDDTSRKIIGSSVVTSVSVILNGEEPSKFSDAIGKPIPRPLVPPQVASPINLLNPDRYEFYTFNDSGDLIKRLMTMKEIQSIVAGGSNEGSVMHHLGSNKDENLIDDVEDIVMSVQQVLNDEVEAKKNISNVHNVLDTPDVSSTWSIILPAVFGNTGHDIRPHKPQIVMTPDSVIVDVTEKTAANKVEIMGKPSNDGSVNKIDDHAEKKTAEKPTAADEPIIHVTQKKPVSGAFEASTPRSSAGGYEEHIFDEIHSNQNHSFHGYRRKTTPAPAASTTASTTEYIIKSSKPTPSRFVTRRRPTTTETHKIEVVTTVPTNAPQYEEITTEPTQVTDRTTEVVTEILSEGSTEEELSDIGTTDSDLEPLTTAATESNLNHESAKLMTYGQRYDETTTAEVVTEIQTERENIEQIATTEFFNLFDSNNSFNQIMNSLKDIPRPDSAEIVTENNEVMTATLIDDVTTTESFMVEEKESSDRSTEKLPTIDINQRINQSNVYLNQQMFVDEQEPLVYDIPTTTDLPVDTTEFNEESTHKDEDLPVFEEVKLQYPETSSIFEEKNPIVQQIDNFIHENTAAIADSLAVESVNNENKVANVVSLDNLTLSEFIGQAATVASILSNDADTIPIKEIVSQLVLSPQLRHDELVPTTNVTSNFHEMEVLSLKKDDAPIAPTKDEDNVSYETSVIKETSSISMSSNQPADKLIKKPENDETKNAAKIELSSELFKMDADASTEISEESDVHEVMHMIKLKMPPKVAVSLTPSSTENSSQQQEITEAATVTEMYDEIKEESLTISSENNHDERTTTISETQDDLFSTTVSPNIDRFDQTTMSGENSDVTSQTTNHATESDPHYGNFVSDILNTIGMIDEDVTAQKFNITFDDDNTQDEGTDDVFNESTTIINGMTTEKSRNEQTTVYNHYEEEIENEIIKKLQETLEERLNPKTERVEIYGTSYTTESPIIETTTGSFEKNDVTTNKELETATESETVTNLTEEHLKDLGENEEVESATETEGNDGTETATSSEIFTTEISNVLNDESSTDKIIVNQAAVETTETGLYAKDEEVFIKLGETTILPTTTQPSLKSENDVNRHASIINVIPSKKHATLKIDDRTSGISKPSQHFRPHPNDQKLYQVNTGKPSLKMPPSINTLKIKVSNSNRRPMPVKLDPAPKQALGLEQSTVDTNADILEFTKLCNELAFSFWKSLTSEGISSARSLVISPFALTSMLAMIFLGARGSTSGEMNEMLRLDDMVTFNPHLIFRNITDSAENTKDSAIANSAFVRELFSDRSKAGLSANIFQTDCSKATVNERDGEMFFQVLPAIRQRRLVPIPAAVYKSGFMAGYDPEMDATAVAFGGSDVVSTIFVMPGQQGHSAPGDNLERLESVFMSSDITNNAWRRLLTTVMPRQGLEVQIPRFSHRSFINATYGLQKMGLNDLFNFDKADLRGLTGSTTKDMFISDMIQINTFSTCGEDKIGDQHHVELYPAPPLQQRNINYEESLDADYANIGPVSSASSDEERSLYDPLFDDQKYLELPLPLRPRQARIPEAPRLRFDKPFLYFVRHNPTGMILYMGRFNPRLLP